MPEKKKTRGVLFISSICTVLLIGYADYLSGPVVALSLFYLVPIAAVSWYCGKWYGIGISVFANTCEIIANISFDHSYPRIGIQIWNFFGRLFFYLLAAYLISFVKDLLEKEKSLARIDPLSGLPNQRAFFESAEIELVRSRRYGHPLSFAYIDLDNFKEINDLFGHLEGDRVLKAVASVIQECIRRSDVAARLGGDEFILLFPETDYGQSDVAMKKIRKGLFDEMSRNGWDVTFSIGLGTFTSIPESVDGMIHKVDDLMYSVKNSGKNAVSHVTFG